MERTVRAVLEGDQAAPGRVLAADVARLIFGLEAALRQAAHVVLRRPKRTATGRDDAVIERATRLRFVSVEEGSFVGVLALPDVVGEIEDELGLEYADLGYLAWQRLLDSLPESAGANIDPALARCIVKLADEVNLGGRTSRIRLESTGRAGEPDRHAIIDESTRQRMRVVSARPEPQQDVVHGRLFEADFERRTARLRSPVGTLVTVRFDDGLADDIQAALRESGTFAGDVVYDQVSGQAREVLLHRVVPTGDQLDLFGDFHQHRTVTELAAEQGVSMPQQLQELHTKIVDDDELTAFVAAAEQL